jgi:hypothetical protein
MSEPGRVEKGLAIVVLLLSTGAFLNLFLKHGKFTFESEAGLPFMQLIWASLYLVVLVFLLKEARGFGGLLVRGWPFLLLLAICLLSILWSEAKGLTARRSVALVATTFTGFYFALRYSFKEQLKLLVALSKICIVLSLMFGALHLGTAVDSRSGPLFGLYIQGNSRGILSFLFDVLPIEFFFGRLYEPWFGIFTQRNTLGIMMAFAIFVFYLWSRSDPEEKWSAYLWASLSFLLLHGSVGRGDRGSSAVEYPATSPVGTADSCGRRGHGRSGNILCRHSCCIGNFLFRPRRYSYRSHNHLGGFVAPGDGSPLDRSRIQCLLARGRGPFRSNSQTRRVGRAQRAQRIPGNLARSRVLWSSRFFTGVRALFWGVHPIFLEGRGMGRILAGPVSGFSDSDQFCAKRTCLTQLFLLDSLRGCLLTSLYREW